MLVCVATGGSAPVPPRYRLAHNYHSCNVMSIPSFWGTDLTTYLETVIALQFIFHQDPSPPHHHHHHTHRAWPGLREIVYEHGEKNKGACNVHTADSINNCSHGVLARKSFADVNIANATMPGQLSRCCEGLPATVECGIQTMNEVQ